MLERIPECATRHATWKEIRFRRRMVQACIRGRATLDERLPTGGQHCLESGLHEPQAIPYLVKTKTDFPFEQDA